MTETTTGITINALKNGDDIIEILLEKKGATVAEVSAEMNLARSTVYDYLCTLQELRYVVKNDDATYRPSTKFLNVGEMVRSQMELSNVVTPELDDLADVTGEHASLMIEEHGRGVLLTTVRGDKAVDVDTHNGMQVDIHTAAPGKAILAYLPESRVLEIIDEHGLDQHTDNTITDRDELFAELEDIRERKVAFDREERIVGMRSVAVPILDRDDAVQGSISVYGPTNRFSEERYTEEIPQLLLRSANVIEINLNYR